MPNLPTKTNLSASMGLADNNSTQHTNNARSTGQQTAVFQASPNNNAPQPRTLEEMPNSMLSPGNQPFLHAVRSCNGPVLGGTDEENHVRPIKRARTEAPGSRPADDNAARSQMPTVDSDLQSKCVDKITGFLDKVEREDLNLIEMLVLYPLNNSAIASLKAFKHPSKWFRHCFVVIVYEG